VTEGIEAVLAEVFAALRPHLNERQRRLVLGAAARALGRGGIRSVAGMTGAAESTVSRGVRALESGAEPSARVRTAGAGRKRLRDGDPGLVDALLALVEPDQRGDPESPLRWTTRSTRNLAAELTRQGHRIGPDTVAALLKAEGFSLQGTSRTSEGARHPDRDAQFRYINDQVKQFRAAGQPAVSVDTKKKEVLGDYAVAAREWHRAGRPVRVRVHDFPDKDAPKAVPYGIYDLAAAAGWVAVGCDGDTAAFAVATLRRWWDGEGRHRYPGADRLLITADAGGANGYRVRAWKQQLAGFAHAAGLEVTVCHFPPGTSKWNQIEHRLFSRISTNWRGRPLTSHEVVVNTIGATTTRTGLTVHAELDPGTYPTGVTIPDEVLQALPLTPTTGTAPGTTPCGPSRPHRRRCRATRTAPSPKTERPTGCTTPPSPAWSTPRSPACWPRSSGTSSTIPRSACTTSTPASASCAAAPCPCPTGCWSPSCATAGRPGTEPSPPCSARRAPPPATLFTR
jgi:Rhodopirellula transposase DDE domain